MSKTVGRSALGLLTFLALASTLLTLSPTRDVEGVGPCGGGGNCSGHGTCLNGSFCLCDGPCYSGSVCETECSGHGSCLNSSCSCTPPFGGFTCSSCDACHGGLNCSVECSGHGTCMSGSCACDSGYTGSLCGSVVPCPGGCGAHGTCVNNSCACFTGYVGTNCNVPACATDGDCDDGDACTTDICDTASGICDRTSNVAGCLDSMWCYQSKIRSGSPKFVTSTTQLQDHRQTKNMTIKKPSFFCEPVVRTPPGGSLNNPGVHMECFQVKQNAQQSKFPNTNVDSTTALGTNPLVIKNAKLLCLPATHP